MGIICALNVRSIRCQRMMDRATFLANLVCLLMLYGEGEDTEKYTYGVGIRRDSAKQKQTVFFRMADRTSRQIYTMEEHISDTSFRLYGNKNEWVYQIVAKFTERWEYFKKMGVFPPKDSRFG